MKLAFENFPGAPSGVFASKIMRGIMEDRGHSKISDQDLQKNISSVTDDELALGVAKTLNYHYVKLFPSMSQIRREQLPVCRQHQMVVLDRVANVQTVAVARPWDNLSLQAVHQMFRAQNVYVVITVASHHDILQAISASEERLMTVGEGSVGILTESRLVYRSGNDEETTHDLAHVNPEDDSEAMRLFNELCHFSLARKASDMQIMPYDRNRSCAICYVPHRLVIREFDRVMHQRLLGIIRAKSKIDPTRSFEPQDGQMQIRREDGHPIGLRVSMVPCKELFPSCMIRFHNEGNLKLDLQSLALPSDVVACLEKELTKPEGLVLMTGPTGSGKSSTLYACLNRLNESREWNICTVEDPVEVKLEGVVQVEVREKQGVTFASVLRSFLRHRPDVILVGEMRDRESMEIAMHAAMTGHQVFSTLHTRRAVDVLPRLIENGIAPSVLAQCLTLIAAQRLVRPLCEACSRPARLTEECVRKERLPVEWFREGIQIHSRNKEGCSQCNRFGYGRTIDGIFRKVIPVLELMPISQGIRDLMISTQGRGVPEIRQQSRKEGNQRLGDRGLTLLKKGVIDLHEYNIVREEEG